MAEDQYQDPPVDEFGIPIKKKGYNQPTVDEFGIPVKKKGGTDLSMVGGKATPSGGTVGSYKAPSVSKNDYDAAAKRHKELEEKGLKNGYTLIDSELKEYEDIVKKFGFATYIFNPEKSGLVPTGTETQSDIDRQKKFAEMEGVEYDPNDPLKSYVRANENKFSKQRQKPGFIEGTLQSTNPLSEKEKILNYLKLTKTPVVETKSTISEVKPQKQTSITPVKFKKNDSPFDQTKDEAIASASEKLNEVMYGEGDEWIDPIKANINKAKNSTTTKEAAANIAANNLVEMSIAPTGYYANKILRNSIWSQAGSDNLTANMLRAKADDYEKRTGAFQDIRQDINDTGDGNGSEDFYKLAYGQQIDNAAIKAYAEKNENFKQQLEAAGIDINDPVLADRLGSAKAGQIIAEVFSDPEVHEYVQNEAPWLAPAFEAKSKSLINDYKDFGVNYVANKVSKAIQESGYNNIDPVFNFAGKNMKEFARSTAKLELTPQEYEIYEKNILGNEENYLDTPSFFEGMAGGIKSIGSGIKSTFTTPFKSIPENIREGWEKEATNVSADPKGFMKVVRDSGHAVGIVTSLAAMGNVLGGSGTGFYSSKVVPALSGAIPFLGDSLEQGEMKYPNNPVKAWTSALFNTAMYSALSYRIFPVKNVQQAFAKVKPEIATVIENLSSGKITREAARREMNTIAKKGFDFLTGSVTKSTKIAAELTGITALNSMLDKVMGMDDKTFSQYHPDGEIADTFSSMFLSNLVVGGMGKFGEMKRGNKIVENSLYSAASNPKRFYSAIEALEVKDPTINKQEMVDNLKYLTQIKADLDKRGIDPNNQARYLFEAMKEKVQADAIKSTPDANITRMGQDGIKRSQEVKERILLGEDVVGEEQKEVEKEVAKEAPTTEQILQKAIESGQITGVYADMIKAGQGEAVIKDIAQQAQNIGADGKPLNDGNEAVSKKSMVDQFGEEVVKHAVEKYPEKSFTEVKGEPEQVQPIELSPEAKTEVPKELIEDGFKKAGEKSRDTKDATYIGRWMLDNSKKGDVIRFQDGGYEVTQVTTKKDGTKELVLTPFEFNEDGSKEYNNSGIRIISEQSIKNGSNLFENAYTNANGERVVEQSTYESAKEPTQSGIKEATTEETIPEQVQPEVDVKSQKEALEVEKQNAITQATKPKVELELLGETEEQVIDLISDKASKDKDGGKAKIRQHERIRAKLQALKDLIDCV